MGGIHGIYQIVGELLEPVRERIANRIGLKKNNFSYGFGKGIITFMLVDFAWIFFRANTIMDAIGIIRRMCTRYNPWALFDDSLFLCGLDAKEMRIVVLSLCCLLLIDLVRKIQGVRIDVFLKKQNIWFRWMVLVALFVGCAVCGVYGSGYDASQFIYFQF